jgi:23S rRNA (cytidine2498-2'-O)-methyltransferase
VAAVNIVVAQCRAGFEPEAAADLASVATQAQCALDVDAPPGRGYVLARSDTLDRMRWSRAEAASPPIFIRSSFVGAGPHALVDPAQREKTDRVTPLIDAIVAMANAPYSAVWMEFPDTNEGKAMSTLARALFPRVEAHLRERAMIDSRATRRLHLFLEDGRRACVGTSDAATGSRWPMGIPRLRMPRDAPARSTLKLAEAFIVFLGEREATLLRPGLRAVDLGSAPGGWTWQLAQRGLRVTAVDNGALKGEVASDPLVTHVRDDGLKWRPRRSVDWLVCDIVLQPKRIAALVAEWMADGAARRAIFNLKLPMKKRYDEVQRAQETMSETLTRAGVRFELVFRQLYYDREEVTGYIARID